MEVDKREILRYLGYGRKEAGKEVSQLIEEVLEELFEKCSPKAIHRDFPLAVMEGGQVDLHVFQAESRHLAKNLKDCEQVIFFAATLGLEPDQMVSRYSKFEMSRAVVVQAAAAAMLESFCDKTCKALGQERERQGFFPRPRFSPGYGDFPLECQRPLLGALEAEKRIGIHLTDSLLMAPSKSVSAVIGLSRKPHRCDVRGCELCGKKDCAYRRDGGWQ